MAAELRNAGFPVSSLVRQAIRAEYERRIGQPKARRRPSHIVAEILAALPDPARSPARAFALTDRRAVRDHLASKAARRRR